jgi:hypothetical protein
MIRFQAPHLRPDERDPSLPPVAEAEVTICHMGNVIRITLWGGEETHVFTDVIENAVHVTAIVADSEPKIEVNRVYPEGVKLTEHPDMGFDDHVFKWLEDQFDDGFANELHTNWKRQAWADSREFRPVPQL